MATWSHTVKTKEVHEWYVPDGDHAQLLQAIYQARTAKAAFLRVNDGDLSDGDVWFKAADEGVIVYYEIDVTNDTPPF